MTQHTIAKTITTTAANGNQPTGPWPGICEMRPPPSLSTIHGAPSWVEPCAMINAAPAAMLRVASVAMNGCGSRPLTRSNPLIRPSSSPISRVTPIDRSGEWLCLNTTVHTTHASETFDPIDRSIPLVRMTRSWPIAMTQTPADCSSTLPMFPNDQNRWWSVPNHKKMTMNSNMNSGPPLRANKASLIGVDSSVSDAPLVRGGAAAELPTGSTSGGVERPSGTSELPLVQGLTRRRYGH